MGPMWPIIFIVSLLVATNSAIQVVEFGTERIEGNVFEIQPNDVIQPIVDFSICIRFKFWSWDYKILFGNSFMFFVMFPPRAFLVLNDTFGVPFDVEELKVSPTLWNSFCWAYNSTNSSLTLAVNNFTQSTNVNKTMMEPESLRSTIMIGDNPQNIRGYYRFSGQVTDVNVWNRTLNEREIKSFTIHCTEGANIR